MITGTGFMISSELLEKLGGWNSATISEDLELTAQCVLAGGAGVVGAQSHYL